MDYQVKKDVKKILTITPDTRADDMVLYYAFLVARGVNIDNIGKVFVDSRYRVSLGIPTFACVSRMRRKVQETYPELRPSKEQVVIKQKLEKEYRDFYRKPLLPDAT